MEKKEHGSWWIWIILVAILYFLNSNSNTESDTTMINNIESIATVLPAPTYIAPAVTSKPTYNYSPDYFNDYECTDDCSGHEAGYDWAVDKDIQSYDDCGGNSNSFIEGCYSYVDENYGEESEEYYSDW